MRIRWFVLFAALLIVFPGPTVGFCQNAAQGMISGLDSLVDAPSSASPQTSVSSVGGSVDGR